MQAMTEQVEARGELDRTIIVFLTDNGFSFGEHRWTGKRCPYEPCVRTPLAIRSPWAAHATVDDLVLNVDLAPDGPGLRRVVRTRSPTPRSMA